MIVIYEIFRWIGVIIGYPFKWFFFKNKTYYENENVKKRTKGGALVISNHFNPLDYVMLVFVFFPRKLFVVASEDAFRNPFRKYGMRFWGGIKVDRRTNSMRFVSQSIKEIKKGHLVLIFPEGHNSDDGTMKPFYPSYVLIANRADAPIVPIISDGNYGFFRRVHLMVGETIDIKQYLPEGKVTTEDMHSANEKVYQRMLELQAELHRRIAADKEGKRE